VEEIQLIPDKKFPRYAVGRRVIDGEDVLGVFKDG